MTAPMPERELRDTIGASELDYLDEALLRSKERRLGLFGPTKTSRAEAAEAVLLAYVPRLLRVLRRRSWIVRRDEGKE